MSSQFLPVIRSNAALDLAEILPAIIDGNVDFLTILDFCHYYRIKGICALFLEGVPHNLYLDLYKSGRAFLHYLRNTQGTEKVTSKADPFFDSIGCKDFECAREIAKYSRMSWNSEEEYEDDFLYVYFLMKHFFLDSTHAEMDNVIRKYEQVLDNENDVHFEFCRAFIENDNLLFEEALNRFLIEREERFKGLLSTDSLPEAEAATEGNFSCEGLALIRLAEIKGFKIQEGYLFIPSVLQEDIVMDFEDDDWRHPGE